MSPRQGLILYFTKVKQIGRKRLLLAQVISKAPTQRTTPFSNMQVGGRESHLLNPECPVRAQKGTEETLVKGKKGEGGGERGRRKEGGMLAICLWLGIGS